MANNASIVENYFFSNWCATLYIRHIYVCVCEVSILVSKSNRETYSEVFYIYSVIIPSLGIYVLIVVVLFVYRSNYKFPHREYNA